MDFEIRQATIDDIPEITSLFRNTIININSRDYSDKQIKVWASGADDIEKWEKRINNDYFIVAEANNQIIGFSYLTKGNYLDGLFVHKDYQRKTIASKLLRIMESRASINGFDVLKSDVSITARPFFESKGYQVVKENTIPREGEVLINYDVIKVLN